MHVEPHVTANEYGPGILHTTQHKHAFHMVHVVNKKNVPHWTNQTIHKSVHPHNFCECNHTCLQTNPTPRKQVTSHISAKGRNLCDSKSNGNPWGTIGKQPWKLQPFCLGCKTGGAAVVAAPPACKWTQEPADGLPACLCASCKQKHGSLASK